MLELKACRSGSAFFSASLLYSFGSLAFVSIWYIFTLTFGHYAMHAIDRKKLTKEENHGHNGQKKSVRKRKRENKTKEKQHNERRKKTNRFILHLKSLSMVWCDGWTQWHEVRKNKRIKILYEEWWSLLLFCTFRNRSFVIHTVEEEEAGEAE